MKFTGKKKKKISAWGQIGAGGGVKTHNETNNEYKLLLGGGGGVTRSNDLKNQKNGAGGGGGKGKNVLTGGKNGRKRSKTTTDPPNGGARKQLEGFVVSAQEGGRFSTCEQWQGGNGRGTKKVSLVLVWKAGMVQRGDNGRELRQNFFPAEAGQPSFKS